MLINPLESVFLIAEIEQAICQHVIEIAYVTNVRNMRIIDGWDYVPLFLRPLVEMIK
jgi:hypothetical protein